MDPVPSPRGKMCKKPSADIIECRFEPSTQELDDRKEADLAMSDRLADELKSDVLPKQEEFITDVKGRQKTVPLIHNTEVKSTAAPMKKYKTKMCPNLSCCLRRAHCNYAHNSDELAMYTIRNDEGLTPYYRKPKSLYAHGRGELRNNSPFNSDAPASTQAIARVSHGYMEQRPDENSWICLLRIIPAIETLGLTDSMSLTGLHGQVKQMDPLSIPMMELFRELLPHGVELIVQKPKSSEELGSIMKCFKTKAVAESGLNTHRESAEVVKRTGSEKFAFERQKTPMHSESWFLQNIPQNIELKMRTLNCLGQLDENISEDPASSTDESNYTNSEKEDDRDKLDEEMERLLDTHQVKRYQLFHLPNKCNEIKVSGSGVTPLKEKLVSTAKKYDYTVVVKELDFPPTSQTGPVISNWISLCSGNFALASKENEISHISVMEVIVQAKDKRRQRDQLDYFGVTTAHSFLTKEDNDNLMASSANFLEVVTRMATEHVRLNYYMNVPRKVGIDVSGNPLPLYRYWRREGVCCEWSALQDVAFVRLDREQVRSDGLLRAGNLDVSENHQVLLSGDIDLHHIHCGDDAKKLEGRRILCNRKPGKLIRPPKVKDKGFILGVHLAFELDDGECLKEGDCGSAVYLDDKQSRPMIGMFFGLMKEPPLIHQAVLLSWNLKLAEKTPDLKIQEIKLAEDEDEETDN